MFSSDTDIASITDNASTKFDEVITGVDFNALVTAADKAAFKTLVSSTEDKIKTITQNKPPSFPLHKYLWVHFFQTCLLYLSSNANTDLLECIGTEVITRLVGPMREERKKYNTGIGQTDMSQGTLFGSFDSVKQQVNRNGVDAGEIKRKLVVQFGLDLLTLRDWQMIAIRSWLSDVSLKHIYQV